MRKIWRLISIFFIMFRYGLDDMAVSYLFSNGRHVGPAGEWEQWDVTVAVALVQSTLGTTCVDAVFVMVKE